MERFSFSDEASANLSEIPLSTLSAEIAARKIEAATQEQPFIQTVAETDGLTPLFQILLEQMLF